MSDTPIVTVPSAQSPNRQSGYVQSRSRSGSQILLHVLLIFALAAVAGMSWFLWTMYGELDRTAASLAIANDKIAILESNLSRTQGTLSETDEDTTAALSLWESEIRKLWDIANKRNKDWIEDNRADIQRNAALHGDLTAKVEADVGDLVNSVAQLRRQQQDLTDTVNLSVQQNASFRAQIEQRVIDNEEAIRAIDTSRLQNNNRLLDIDRRVRTLESQ